MAPCFSVTSAAIAMAPQSKVTLDVLIARSALLRRHGLPFFFGRKGWHSGTLRYTNLLYGSQVRNGMFWALLSKRKWFIKTSLAHSADRVGTEMLRGTCVSSGQVISYELILASSAWFGVVLFVAVLASLWNFVLRRTLIFLVIKTFSKSFQSVCHNSLLLRITRLVI